MINFYFIFCSNFHSGKVAKLNLNTGKRKYFQLRFIERNFLLFIFEDFLRRNLNDLSSSSNDEYTSKLSKQRNNQSEKSRRPEKKREKRQPTKLIFPPIATIYCALKAWCEQLEYSRGSKQLITPLLIRLMGWGIREFFCKLTGIIQMTLCY